MSSLNFGGRFFHPGAQVRVTQIRLKPHDSVHFETGNIHKLQSLLSSGCAARVVRSSFIFLLACYSSSIIDRDCLLSNFASPVITLTY